MVNNPGIVSASWPPPECLRMAHWPALDVEAVDGSDDPMDWVQRYSEHGVLAARKTKPNRKKGGVYHMYLLFKDVARRDLCLRFLADSLVNCPVHSFQYTDALVNCFGLVEVRYMQEVYINSLSLAEVKGLLAVGPVPYSSPTDAIPEMLDYKRFPPLIDPRPGVPKQEHVRSMMSVEFDTEWLSRRLYNAQRENPLSVTIGMRRMEMQMIAHKTPAKGTPLGFTSRVWPPAGGTMISDLRQIARWARADLGGTVVSSNVETFGRTKVRPAWRIVLEIELDQPRYYKPSA
jgi:hypothetical protein